MFAKETDNKDCLSESLSQKESSKSSINKAQLSKFYLGVYEGIVYQGQLENLLPYLVVVRVDFLEEGIIHIV